MRYVSMNFDIADIEALRLAVAAYLSLEHQDDASDGSVRSRLELTLSELEAVLNRPAPRRLSAGGGPVTHETGQPSHLRLIHSINGKDAEQST
jgi:hypothetical protein